MFNYNGFRGPKDYITTGIVDNNGKENIQLNNANKNKHSILNRLFSGFSDKYSFWLDIRRSRKYSLGISDIVIFGLG